MRGKYAKIYPVNTISLRQAETKYGIPHNTLSGWVASGIVRVARRPETRGQSLLVFEADVQKAAEHWTPGRGGRDRVKRLAEKLAATG